MGKPLYPSTYLRSDPLPQNIPTIRQQNHQTSEMQLNTFEERLMGQYQSLYEKDKPDTTVWHETTPAIPFVGDQFGNDGRARVLVYGSAENLNWDYPRDMAFSRNREVFNQWKAKEFQGLAASVDHWFPWLHMTPVSDGSLLTAARYLVEVFGKTGFSENPEAFIQQIAVGNYGKFSQKGKVNRDYANNPTLLRVSDPYVLADMEVLRPDVVVLPRTIFNNRFTPILNGSKHKPEHIWQIYQTNARAINVHIKRQLKKTGLESSFERSGWQKEWLSHIKKANMGLYMDWLDWRSGKVKGCVMPNWNIDYTVH